MKHTTFFRTAALTLMLCMALAAPASAWMDQSHMAIGLAAGFGSFHACGAPDVARTVSAVSNLTQSDEPSHYANFELDHQITSEDVREQLALINDPEADRSVGYLLGAIVRCAQLCREKAALGEYDDSCYAVLLHYVGDLSQPLHVSIYDEFNQTNHLYCDDILSDTEAKYPVLAAIALAAELTVADVPTITTEEEMVDAAVALATQSQQLGNTMRAEDRLITREEALTQLSRAAALGNAILRYCGKIE